MLFEVKKTIGICFAFTVPSSGIDTWYSERISSSSASVSSSTRSTSSIKQHDRFGRRDRFEERPGEQELLAEDVLFERLPILGAVTLGPSGLDAQELLAIVPLVERLGVVESLVALESDQSRPDGVGDRLGEGGLAGAGRTFHEHRLRQPVGEEADRGDGVVAQVVVLGQAREDVLRGVEAHRRYLAESES